MASRDLNKSREEIREDKKRERRSVRASYSTNWDGPFGTIQFILYCISIPLGFLVSIPVGIIVQDFNHVCPLFADVSWKATVLWSRSDGACGYVIFGNAAISIVYGLFMAIATYFIISRKSNRDNPYTRLSEHVHERFVVRGINPVFTFINTFVVVLLFCSAVICTTGAHRICQQLQKGMEENPSFSFKSCLSDVPWGKLRMFGGSENVKGSGFFPGMIIASIAAWLLVIDWFILLILNCAICCGKLSLEISEEKLKPTAATREAFRKTMSAQTSGRTTPRTHGPPSQYSGSLPYRSQQPYYGQVQPQYQYQTQQGQQPYVNPVNPYERQTQQVQQPYTHRQPTQTTYQGDPQQYRQEDYRQEPYSHQSYEMEKPAII